MDTNLLADLQTILQSWQTVARREREKLGIPGRIGPYPEYRDHSKFGNARC